MRLPIRRQRPAILMYHRVASVRHDPWGLTVQPRRFAEHIEFFRRHRQPLSMTELVDRLHAHTLPANAVAITFDDGYRDNVVAAKPVLTKYGVPATFFIATGYVGVEAPFWWDELSTMILQCAHSAQYVETIAGEPVHLDWGRPQREDLAGTWRAAHAPKTDRQRCYLAVWSRLQRAGAAERERVLRSLRKRFEAQPDPLAMPMNAAEVQALVADESLQLGAHSVGHPMLTTLTRLERIREIRQSAEACHALSGTPVPGFAYPYGDVDAEASADVAAAGFQWACATRGGFLDGERPDVYALPRIAVPDVSVRELRSLLSR